MIKGRIREGKNKRERESGGKEGRKEGRLERRRETYIPVESLFLGTKELCLGPSWSKLMSAALYAFPNIPKYFVTYCQIRLQIFFLFIKTMLLFSC